MRYLPGNLSVYWLCLLLSLLPGLLVAQERDQYQSWLELLEADQTYGARSAEIGRTRAFLEFLGEGSVVFRDAPVDARELYTAPDFEGNDLRWESHYIDVSRDGDLGLTAGPLVILDAEGDAERNTFGHLVSIWKKVNGRWVLMADMATQIPGFLSLEVEPDYEETRTVLQEAAHPVLVQGNELQDLIDADNLFGRSVNFRGGQRALLRYGMENSRVYLPGMAPAVGVEAASSVYGAFLDNQLSTTNPISLTYMGGYLSTSKEMGYTYGTMSTNTDEADAGFRTSYLRLWRYTNNNEWRISVEVLNPVGD
jgi:ketosteroid isomerase-like protein